MISKEALLMALTKELQAAQAGDEQATRDALIAMRALCNTALNATPAVTPPISVVPSMQPTRMEEDDANGESIFDF